MTLCRDVHHVTRQEQNKGRRKNNCRKHITGSQVCAIEQSTVALVVVVISVRPVDLAQLQSFCM